MITKEKKLNIKILSALIILLSISGCRVYQPIIEETGYYHTNPDVDIYSFNSLTVVTPSNSTKFPSISKTIGSTLYNTLIKKHLFQVNYISSNENIWHQISAFPDDIDKNTLKRYRKLLKTDAVLIGKVTEYKPFPFVVIGLQLKIYDLRTGQLAWSLQQIWDSSDKGVENRIKRYFDKNIKTGYEPINWQYVRTSPKAYQKFICFEVVSTLPGNNFYSQQYIEYKNSKQSIRDKALRPVIHFPAKAKDIIGLK